MAIDGVLPLGRPAGYLWMPLGDPAHGPEDMPKKEWLC